MTDELIVGGATVGGAWILKECFAFFLKLRKQDKQDNNQFYRPEEHWKTYITQKFEEISSKLNELFIAQEFIKNQMLQLQYDRLKVKSERRPNS